MTAFIIFSMTKLWNKRSPFFPKVNHRSFYFKDNDFQNSLKVIKYLGYFYKKNMSARTFNFDILVTLIILD